MSGSSVAPANMVVLSVVFCHGGLSRCEEGVRIESTSANRGMYVWMLTSCTACVCPLAMLYDRIVLISQKADTYSAQDLGSALEEVEAHGLGDLPWDRLKLTLRRSHASSYLTSLGSWDDWKRQAVRGVLRETRKNFHKYPRPW